MSIIKTKGLKQALPIFCCVALPALVTPAGAAPGTLAQVPLFANTAVEPNIMFLIDDSGSMSNVVPDSPYDPGVTYFTCPGGITIAPADGPIDIRVTGAGIPYFRLNDTTDYDWGTTESSNGDTSKPMRCFDPAASGYDARLNANGGGSGETKSPDGYLDAEYSGNYLNWYFGSSPTNWGSDARLKKLPDASFVKSRLSIAKSTATDLINNRLDKVRVGLASYDGDDGAHINVGIDSIDNNRATLLSQIDALSAGGNTPLAEALQDIGRYFVGYGGAANPGNQSATGIVSNGQFDGDLVLHPGAANQSTLDEDTVFDQLPLLDAGVSSESPVLYWCQKNFSVLMTDGRPVEDQNISLASGLQDYDGDCLGTDPACGLHDQKDASLGYEYESSGSDYLDDVAKALFEIDLRPDIDDFEGNEIVNNLRTYTIGFADDQVINDPLMADTADNGGGLFLTATDSGQLQAAFEATLQDIAAKIGSAAAVTFNSGNITTNSRVYLALFNTYRWSGQLMAYVLNGLNGDIDPTPLWDAAAVLDSRNLSTSPRAILTYNGSDGAAFTWSTLSVAQQADLCTGPESGGCSLNDQGNSDPGDDTIDGDTTVAQARLAFLRGERGDEGSGQNFRVRGSRLGDIVHAGPVYVGEPEVDWPDSLTPGAPYSAFRTAYENRTEIVYIGANDGMLHGFRADTGVEVLAYVPGALYSNGIGQGLHYLSDPDYGHRFYVDLEPTVSDAYVKTRSSDPSPDWHTVLIGGLRAGGRGYFALDITDPAQFSESNAADLVMWEFSSDDDADLGHSFSAPTIAMMENDRWAAVFGNGYEDLDDAGADDGQAQLFIVFLDGGLDGSWSEGSDYVKITTGAGSDASRNGLSMPGVIDLDGNGKADRVYAGDLQGNLWAFDLADSNAGNWDVAYKQSTTPKPLFTAVDGSSNPQPITSWPLIINHPTVADQAGSNEPNLLVIFGTGQYLVDSDNTSTDLQSFYSVWDDGSQELTPADLIAQTFETGVFTDGNDATLSNVRVLTDNSVPYTAAGTEKRYGWYIDLPASGERVVSNPVVRGDNVFFNTVIPSGVPCQYGGSGWLMAVSVTNGGRSDNAPFDVTKDNSVNETDLLSGGDSLLSDVAASGEMISLGIPAESAFLADYQYTPTSATSGGDEIEKRNLEGFTDPFTGRVSWQELDN